MMKFLIHGFKLPDSCPHSSKPFHHDPVVPTYNRHCHCLSIFVLVKKYVQFIKHEENPKSNLMRSPAGFSTYSLPCPRQDSRAESFPPPPPTPPPLLPRLLPPRPPGPRLSPCTSCRSQEPKPWVVMRWSWCCKRRRGCWRVSLYRLHASTALPQRA